MQVAAVTDTLTFSEKGNQARAVIFRKPEGSGIQGEKNKGIHHLRVSGKGDLALVNGFEKWIDRYSPEEPERLLLRLESKWVSSSFIGCLAGLQEKVRKLGGALALWVEHSSCFEILEKLGVTSFVQVFESLKDAESHLRRADVPESSEVPEEVDE